ncbi:glycosyltransferase [Sphingomonas montanisoli]|uniref:Glycosyltransferase family 4 protein n=1 Tax=Sphingomonas montanisoli TaxID=2606412 RepID=A0A5D9CA62_9SPHN|nr:glycosyltransferase [Sphingomonas montanisoli]TZG27950.1 glycosyltransferase family 4 protein [Sphingomonas montanisoli]
MKICFIGHKFHAKTGSSAFFRKILSEIGDVTELHSSPDEHPLMDDEIMRGLLSSDFDRYVFWQTEYIAERLLCSEPGKMIIIPMFDGAWGRSDDYWRKFARCRFISFSRSHHETLQRLDCKSSYFQYFPDPGLETQRPIDTSDLDGFFWERRAGKHLSTPLVVKMAHALGIRRLHVHLASDFAHANEALRYASCASDRVELTFSKWFESRDEYERVAHQPLFYFAPREREGIGMAVLEAMAQGQIVVAPDMPTMNEYVAHRCSGLLYDSEDSGPSPALARLTGEELAQLSSEARRKVAAGRQDWLRDVDRLKSIIADDGKRWSTLDVSAHFANQIRLSAHGRVHNHG